VKKCLQENEHNVPVPLILTPVSAFLWLTWDVHCSILGILDAHRSTRTSLHMALPSSSLTHQPSEGRHWLWLDATTSSHPSQLTAAR